MRRSKALFGLILFGLLVFTGFLWMERARLLGELVETKHLQSISQQQQAEIETLTRKVKKTEEELTLLKRLAERIEALTGATTPAANLVPPSPNAGPSLGRGGPKTTTMPYGSPPVLSTMLPAQTRSILFGRYPPTLTPSGSLTFTRQAAEAKLAKAKQANAKTDAQLLLLDQLHNRMTEQTEALVQHLDHLAHRPNGLPVPSERISDRFGLRWNPFGWGIQFHHGVDLAEEYGTPITATADGTVTYTGLKSGGFGNAVMLDHGNGFVTLYAHMDDWNVKVGQRVTKGAVIGWVGSSGLSTGPHLHYEVHFDDQPINPQPYLN